VSPEGDIRSPGLCRPFRAFSRQTTIPGASALGMCVPPTRALKERHIFGSSTPLTSLPCPSPEGEGFQPSPRGTLSIRHHPRAMIGMGKQSQYFGKQVVRAGWAKCVHTLYAPLCVRQKSITLEFVYLESKNYREFEVLESLEAGEETDEKWRIEFGFIAWKCPTAPALTA
jgi:hypothetical protein